MIDRETLVYRGGRRAIDAAMGAALVGLFGLLVGAVTNPRQALFSYLTAYAYVASIVLGTMAFLMIVHAMGATWPLVVRRVCEAVVSTTPLVAVLFAPVLAFPGAVYPWVHPETVAGAEARETLHHQAPYLNVPFFTGRAIGYLLLWTVLGALLFRWSVEQDASQPERFAGRLRVLSAVALPVLGLSLTFASFDWLMTLTPGWTSTMYGVYWFAGGFLGALALLSLVTHVLDRTGDLPVQSSHYYALGRLLLSFTIFWAYIAYFQFFLIWIADKPNEVPFYVARTRGTWGTASVVLALVQFVVPFFALLPYAPKRRGRFVGGVAAWLLAAHYLDTHWLVAPAAHPEGFRLHWLDVAALLALGGGTVALGVYRLRGRPILPRSEPRLEAAIRYESL